MARPRKPTAALELQGAFRKNPSRGRARANEPKPQGPLGDPPERFSDAEKATWHEIASNLAPGVGTNDCRTAFGHLCRLVAKMDKDGIGGRYGVTNGEQNAMLQLYGKFGMTPSDRSKISVSKSNEESNPFAEIAGDSESTGRPN